MIRRAVLLALLFLAAPAAAAEEKLPVVATFSILGDLVAQVGGDRVAVRTLVGPDGDAHIFSPSPADAKAVASAKLVVTNGVGLEGWMSRLVSASGTKAPVVVAAKAVKPIAGEKDGHGHSHASDPHAWQDVANAKLYVAAIRDGLVAADPGGKAAYEANGARYLASLDALDAEVKAAVASIPPARRRVITSHDAFGYFASAYGMTFVAPQGVSTASEASAKDVAALVRQIKRDKVPAVFVENITDTRLMDRIAQESGARVGGRVYSDALSAPGGPASTYVDMMRHNAREFAKALAN